MIRLIARRHAAQNPDAVAREHDAVGLRAVQAPLL